MLHWQAAKIDIGAFVHNVVAGCGGDDARHHAPELLQHTADAADVAQAARRLRIFQRCQRGAKLA